jgi:hypothetical protein
MNTSLNQSAALPALRNINAHSAAQLKIHNDPAR